MLAGELGARHICHHCATPRILIRDLPRNPCGPLSTTLAWNSHQSISWGKKAIQRNPTWWNKWQLLKVEFFISICFGICVALEFVQKSKLYPIKFIFSSFELWSSESFDAGIWLLTVAANCVRNLKHLEASWKSTWGVRAVHQMCVTSCFKIHFYIGIQLSWNIFDQLWFSACPNHHIKQSNNSLWYHR